jgi:hypothetical protein
VFGKKFSEYVRFERWILILIGSAFIIRMAISAAGTPIDVARWVSINIVLLAGLVYCSVAVQTTGFGGYKQLFGLLLIQNVFAHTLIALGIALAVVTGTDNIYTAPEFFGGSSGRNLGHSAMHLIAGFIVPVFAWLVASVILFATKKLKPASLSEAKSHP